MKSKGASKKGESYWYQSFNLVDRGSQRRDSHPANVWSSLKLSLAYNAVHCITDSRAIRAALKDKLKTDVEKNPGPTSQAQRQARNTRRKSRREGRRIKKVLTLQKEWIKGNKTIATWNVQRANIHGRRFGEIAKLCKRRGLGITCMMELNTFNHGIKKFDIDGEGTVCTFYILRKQEY